MILLSCQAGTDIRNEDIFETVDDETPNNIFNEKTENLNIHQQNNLFDENQLKNEQEHQVQSDIFGDNLFNNVKIAFADYYKEKYTNTKQNLRVLYNKIKITKNSNDKNNKFYDIINEFHIPIYCFISTIKSSKLSSENKKNENITDPGNVPIFLAPYIVTDILELRLQVDIVNFLAGNFKDSMNFHCTILDFVIIEYNFFLNLYENSEYLLFPSFFLVKASLETEARKKFKEAREGMVVLFKIIKYLDYYVYFGFQSKYLDFLLIRKTLNFQWQVEISAITICYFYSNYLNIFFLDEFFKFHLDRLTVDIVISNVLLWLLQIGNFEMFKIKVCFYNSRIGISFELSLGSITIVLIYLDKGSDESGGIILSFKFNNFYLDDCIRSSINMNNDIIVHKTNNNENNLRLEV